MEIGREIATIKVDGDDVEDYDIDVPASSLEEGIEVGDKVIVRFWESGDGKVVLLGVKGQ